MNSPEFQLIQLFCKELGGNVETTGDNVQRIADVVSKKELKQLRKLLQLIVKEIPHGEAKQSFWSSIRKGLRLW